MVRTKMTRKKSSMIQKGKSLARKTSTSVESLASSTSSVSEQSDELTVLLSSEYKLPTHFQEAFEAFYAKKVEARKKKYEYCVKYVKDSISNILQNYPESYLSAITISRYDESVLQELNTNLNVVASGSGHRSRIQSSGEEPTEFKKPRTPRKASVPRKTTRTSRKRSLSAPAPAAPLPPPEFKTPMNSARQQMAMMMVRTITPKVSNTPVSVMRRPQHGEVAFSTSGSPLLIGPVSREDIPTVSVPMQDGRVFSILPGPGLPPPDLPDFDEDTKKYLKTLREHLALLSDSP